MNKFIFIFLLGGLLAVTYRSIPEKKSRMLMRPFFSTTERYTFLAGEYAAGIIDNSTKTFYNIGGTATIDTHVPAGTIVGGAAAPHGMCVFDTAGIVYCKGQNGNGSLGIGNTTDQTNFVQITTDSLGNTFKGVIQMCASSSAIGWNTFFLKKDSTVWACGALDAGIRGNGTAGSNIVTRPVQIIFPGGVKIIKIQCGFSCLALASNGDEYTWGANYNFYQPYLMAQCTATPVTNTPTKITLPHPGVDIANNGQTLLTLLNQGSLYGWAYEAGSIGVGSPTDPSPSSPAANLGGLCPWLLDTANAGTPFPTPGNTIVKIFSGSENNYAILSDSTLWVQGDNANGGAGNGIMLNWATYSGAAGWSPYAWDQSYGQLLYRKWRQMAVGKHNWVDVFTGPALVYYAIFEDADGNLYGCGRNKGEVIPNNVGGVDSSGGELQSEYPNSWNIAYLEPVFPFRSYPHIVRTSSHRCLDSAAAMYCNLYPVTTSGSPPVANAGSDLATTSTTISLNGTKTFSSPATGMLQSVWTSVSMPSGATLTWPIQGYDSVTVKVSKTGVYKFALTVEDNLFKLNTDTIQITINATNNITIPAGSRIHVSNE